MRSGNRAVVRTLGTVEVSTATGRVSSVLPAQRKRFALLVFLAVEGQPYRRDSVGTLIWPDLDRRHALTAVRQAIHFLRSELGEIFVEGSQASVGIEAGRLWCDAAALRQAQSTGERRCVADLYGGPFLDGFDLPEAHPDFTFWLDEQRAFFSKSARDAALVLSAEASGAGDLESARAWAQKAIRISPHDELASRALITILHEQGNKVGAIAEYRRLSGKMKNDLDLEPSPEIRSLLPSLPVEGHDQRSIVASQGVPPARSALIGREKEIVEIRELIASEQPCLMTITGVGGVGKSRIAIEIAHEAPKLGLDGVLFIDFASCEDGAEAREMVAADIDLERDVNGVEDTLLGFALAQSHDLVVFDNVEHVASSIAAIATGMTTAPHPSRVIVTSRRSLRTDGERVYPIEPLEVPPVRDITSRPMTEYGAVALFVDRVRARSQKTRWSDEELYNVAEICRRLDGLPLAIELVAARTRVFSILDLLRLLDESSALILRGEWTRPERHQSISRLMEWSYALLSKPERELLRAASCFRGGASLEAIRGVWARGADGEALDHLTSLVDNNVLLASTVSGETRYGMLRTVAEFARTRAGTATDETEWRLHHAEYFASWLSKGALEAFCTDRESEFLRRIDLEHANLVQAMTWASSHGPWEVAARIASKLQYYWWARGEIRTGLKWIGRLLEGRKDGSVELLADLLLGRGSLLWATDEISTAESCMLEARQLYEISGNSRGIARSLQNLGDLYRYQSDLDAAFDCFERVLAIARELGEESREAIAMESLATVHRLRGDLGLATNLLEESLALSKAHGFSHQLGNSLLQLGLVAVEDDRPHEAINLLTKAVRAFDELGLSLDVAAAREALGRALRSIGDLEAGRREFIRALSSYPRSGPREGPARCLLEIAEIDQRQDEWRRALEIASALSAAEGILPDDRDPDFERRLGDLIADLRGVLPPERFAPGWAEGRLLDLDELAERVTSEVDVVRLRAASS